MGALAAKAIAAAAPTRLALLGTLPRKRERERNHAGAVAAIGALPLPLAGEGWGGGEPQMTLLERR